MQSNWEKTASIDERAQRHLLLNTQTHLYYAILSNWGKTIDECGQRHPLLNAQAHLYYATQSNWEKQIRWQIDY